MKYKHIFLMILCFFTTFYSYANLECQDGPCSSGCPCQGKGTQTPGPGKGKSGTAGTSPGRDSTAKTATTVERNGSVNFEIQFGRPANENFAMDAKFSIYTAKPTPTLYSPQTLQYINPFLNRISQNLISQTYKDSIGLSYVSSESRAVYANDEGSASGGSSSLIFRGGYGENEVSNSLPSGITHQTRMIGPNREALLFNFSDGNSTAKMVGDTSYLGYQLQMVNQEGNPVTSNPYYYDLYIGYGSFVRYLVSSGYPVSYHTASGRILKPSDPSVGLEAIYDEDGIIRQVWSFADGLADIVVTQNFVSYEIRIYPPSQVGNKVDGIYQTTGEPYLVVRIENPNPATNTEVAITKVVGGVSYQTLYRYSHAAEGWTMYSPGNLSLDSKTTTYDYSNTVRTVSAVIKTVDGEVARKSSEVYQEFDFGERIVASTLDPDGQALRSSFTYFTDSANSGSYGRIATENLGDGSWKAYTYNANGWATKIISPWLNSAFNSPAQESQELSLSYDPNDDRDIVTLEDKRPRLSEKKILGQTVKKVFKTYYFENNAYIEIQEEATTPTATWGAESNLRTVWKYYPKGDCTSASAGRIQQITYPNGTTESYTYEYGNLQQDAATGNYTFTTGNGSALRVYITHGTTSSPSGIAYKSTREENLYDIRGNLVYSGTQIYTGNDYETANWIRYGYDEQHRVLSELKSNGELTETTWNCCQKASETLPDGTQYLYAYDAMLRLISKTKVGIGDQPDLVTTYQYNAASQIVSETTTGGELSKTIFTEYNLAGMKTKETAETGLVTTFTYLNPVNTGSSRHGISVTVTLPGNNTQTVVLYCDKQIESITGTAQIPVYYQYGVYENGSVWRQELFGGGDSLRRMKIIVSMTNNVISREQSGFGGNVIESNTYNVQNQLIKMTRTGSAPILLEYDELGEIARFGLDVNNDGALELASNDRIVDRNITFFVDDGWWQIVTSKVYGTEDSAVSTIFEIERERLSGFTAGMTAETHFVDIYGNATVETSSLNRNTKTKTITILEPDSTVAGQIVTVNGLVFSRRTTDNLITTYAYDALARLVSVTEPRVGTSTLTYYATMGKKGLPSSFTDANGETTLFDFDSAGRLNLVINSLGKSTCYAYNGYGQITKIWGEAQYPVEFEYDVFGQQTKLKTFRSGNSWNGINWPTSQTPDITTWTYDEASGLVTAKTDAAGQSVDYTYTVDGKLSTRTWARLINGQPLVTSYGYDAATGALLTVDYSDTTPDITYTYGRLGNLATVQDAAGIRTFSYNQWFDRTGETISGIYSKTLSYNYASSGVKGRYIGFSLDDQLNSSYSYDCYGRLNGIAGLGGIFVYSRLTNSGLIENLTRPNEVNTIWSYEAHRDFITQVANSSISTFGYVNDALGRRTSMSRAGSAFSVSDVLSYVYNDRSELISATSSVDESYVYSYSFDSIGNRQTATLSGVNWSYTSNVLNQYTSLTIGVVTETPTYDADGNMLLRDGWTQHWNGENRLIETEKDTVKLQFQYDYMGRRISKKVYENDVLTRHILFVYDDYKLIEELDALNENISLRRYCWQPKELGLDVPLSVHDVAANATYFYTIDANKNVCELTDSSGHVVAHYEYSPFGIQTKVTGFYANINPLGFSSEYYDSEINLVYYNYRYYYPKLGRWLSRDPIEELGGYNLYGMVRNSPIDLYDYLGFGILEDLGNLVRRAVTPRNVTADDLDQLVDNLGNDSRAGGHLNAGTLDDDAVAQRAADAATGAVEVGRVLCEPLDDIMTAIDFVNGEAGYTDIALALAPFSGFVRKAGKAIDKGKDVAKAVDKADDATSAGRSAQRSKTKAKDRRKQQQRQSVEDKHGDPDWQEPASEGYTRAKARELENQRGKDARRKAHDAKPAGAPDRSKTEIDEDYSIK